MQQLFWMRSLAAGLLPGFRSKAWDLRVNRVAMDVCFSLHVTSAIDRYPAGHAVHALLCAWAKKIALSRFWCRWAQDFFFCLAQEWKNGCAIWLDRAGLGVLIEAAEEKKRALLCKRKLLERQVLAQKKGRFLYYAFFLHDWSEKKIWARSTVGLPIREMKSIVSVGESR